MSTPPHTLDPLFRSIGLDRDYSGLDLEGLSLDLHGWASDTDPIFPRVFDELAPQLVIEVGTWKGASLFTMLRLARERSLDTRFICVDTWLGSNESIWLDPETRPHLMLRGGYPTMFRQFVANVLAHDAREAVFPLPMTATSAAHLLRELGVVADTIYIDAGHEEEEVSADLNLYWERVRPGGILFGDDYHTRWSGVIRAVNGFAKRHRLALEQREYKWMLRKPIVSQGGRLRRSLARAGRLATP
jgi:hypothetical protein